MLGEGYYYYPWGDINKEIFIINPQTKDVLNLSFGLPIKTPTSSENESWREELNLIIADMENGQYPNKESEETDRIAKSLRSTIGTY